MARCKMRNARPKAPLGTAIAIGSLAANVLGQGLGLWNSHKQRQAQAEEMQQQLDLQKRQLNLQNLNNQAAALNSGVLSQQDEYPQGIMYANGGKVNSKRIAITDGGYAIPIRRNIFLLKGGSHEDINESGRTGIGLRVGDKFVEAQGDEVIEKLNKEARIFSKDIQMPNGMTIAEYVRAGGNPNLAFKWQEGYKKYYGLNDDGTMKRNKLRSVSSIDRPRAELGTALAWGNAGVGILGSLLSRVTGNSSYNRMKDYLGNYQKTLNNLSPYYGGGFMSGPTNYRNDQAWRTLRQNIGSALNSNYRNTASSNTALQNAQQIINSGNTEAEKIRQDELDKNFEARMKNAEMYNQHNANMAQMINNFNVQKGQLQADFLGKQLDVANSRYSDNTAMWQGIIDSFGGLGDYYMKKEADERQLSLAAAMADGATLKHMSQFINLPKNQVLSAYNVAKEAYNANPTKENWNELDYWTNYGGASKRMNRWRLRNGISQPRPYGFRTTGIDAVRGSNILPNVDYTRLINFTPLR